MFVSLPHLFKHRLMWWVWEKLLLLHLFGLVLLWLYMAGINSTIPVDYCSPNIQGQLGFSPTCTISLKGKYLINQQSLILIKLIPQQHPSQLVSPRINSFYPKTKHFERPSILKDTVLLSPFLRDTLQYLSIMYYYIHNILSCVN